MAGGMMLDTSGTLITGGAGWTGAGAGAGGLSGTGGAGGAGTAGVSGVESLGAGCAGVPDPQVARPPAHPIPGNGERPG
jgi:hypothetical protein